MKKSVKIIIAVSVTVVLLASITAVGLLKGGKDNVNDTTASGTTPSFVTSSETESWFDWDQFASSLNLSNATGELGSLDPSALTSDPTATGPTVQGSSNVAPGTTVVYVYVTDTQKHVTDTTKRVTQPTTSPQMLDFSYTVDKDAGTVTLNRYTGSDSIAHVPDTASGYPVTAIANNCFASKNITSVYLGRNVETVGSGAFSNCKDLQVVYFMGSKVTTLGDTCFSNCTALKSITIPQCVTSIGSNAFAGCSKDLVIRCKEGSVAHDTAMKYDITYTLT